MALSENIQFYAATDVGRVRDHNEDNFLVDKKLALSIVADGMGGHAAGEVASALAVRIIHEEVKKHKDVVEKYAREGVSGRAGAKEILAMLELAVQRACAKIHDEAKQDANKRGMGTTLSALLIVASHGFIAHVGDSRIYLLRGGKVQQITEDHTVYNELIKRGKLTRDQIEKVAQKNAITRAVGVYERVEVDTLTIEVLPGDQFLLASDGLHGYIAHTAELEPYFEEADGETATRELIDLANRKGGKDNITAILVRLGAGDKQDDNRARRLHLKREVLAKMPLFSRLSEREMLRIMQVADVVSYDVDQIVVQEGDRGDELFIVLSGQVRISRGETVLNEFGPGEHFGEMALIRAAPRSATVTAIEPSELIVLHRNDFFEILRKEHELAVKLLWQFLGVLADRLDQTSRDLSSAREELNAEDITDAIFPDEVEPGEDDAPVTEPRPRDSYLPEPPSDQSPPIGG
ncbi:Stp1/IreP family PP2C-type Ser/Thr phosphatase [Polyangium sorediatum]|uniref:Stp1/IreP family PP2C-type Ser/Thr phosphatase n=1 Tax=Polyangium sorediatum TaxID=889274 RepID=A0ABT6P3J5_9BACT|nr:Stp1/IreP family PP2C-type Ser/Thr phosphatase [Polyangium sorediatum]MDI1435169.1 Stp1/IreP family PP2C-type Ser/Thr phosphatase [Polyangium sorediatum]